jgi:hypothetical protein
LLLLELEVCCTGVVATGVVVTGVLATGVEAAVVVTLALLLFEFE